MPPEIIALIAKPYLLTAVLLVGMFAGVTVERCLAKLQRRAWRKKAAGAGRDSGVVATWPTVRGAPNRNRP